MSDFTTFNAEVRERAGKGAARAVRKTGRIPAVIYGDSKDPSSISLEPLEYKKAIIGGGFFSTVFEIKVGGKTEKVLARDVQLHPVTDRPLHLDFLRLGKNTKVTVAVPVNFINEVESPGLKRGGVLNIVRHDLDLVCRGDAIPQSIEIDLTGLEIGDGVHISAVTLPEGVVPDITDRDFTIATVAPPTVMKSVEEEEAEEAAAAEAAEAAEAEAAEGDEE
ncbi:MAG: 50S ribosomal protein L25/general stress protein Ctc [Alphaproteobacteria bacterium]|nr:50S ribosomal protein L25/general stress protein Ctc [Alphaproteobacteria bacterium]